jgi:hypothetical protein
MHKVRLSMKSSESHPIVGPAISQIPQKSQLISGRVTVL